MARNTLVSEKCHPKLKSFTKKGKAYIIRFRHSKVALNYLWKKGDDAHMGNKKSQGCITSSKLSGGEKRWGQGAEW